MLFTLSKLKNTLLSQEYSKPVQTGFGKTESNHKSGGRFPRLRYSADGYESSGIRRTGNRAGTNQGFKPDVLRAVLSCRDAQRTHKLALIHRIRKKSPRGFGPFLLKTLHHQHTPLFCAIAHTRHPPAIL